jgi:hypothetical protein
MIAGPVRDAETARRAVEAREEQTVILRRALRMYRIFFQGMRGCIKPKYNILKYHE